MNNQMKFFIIASLSVGAAGCDFVGRDRGSTDQNLPAVPDYSVIVTSVEMVNKDSGESLTVEGLPLEGGLVNVD